MVKVLQDRGGEGGKEGPRFRVVCLKAVIPPGRGYSLVKGLKHRGESGRLQAWLCHMLVEYPDLGVLIWTMGTYFTQLCDEYLHCTQHCAWHIEAIRE